MTSSAPALQIRRSRVGRSVAEEFIDGIADLSGAREVLDGIVGELTERELAALWHEWSFWARPAQVLPVDRRVVIVEAGRNWGKTRTCAQHVHGRIERGECGWGALVSRTDADVSETMINHPRSGLMNIAPPWFKPRFYAASSTRGASLEYPNGARLNVYSSEVEEFARGPEFDLVWGDEFGAWPVARREPTWDNIEMATRGREDAQIILSTTRRPGNTLLQKLKKLALEEPETYVVVRGHTLDNAFNQPTAWRKQMVRRYAGTRVGRRELGEGEDDLEELVEGAIFSQRIINETRVSPADAPEFDRVAVAVDPAVSVRRGADETGISVGARAPTRHVYVLEDASGVHTADEWPRIAVNLYLRHRVPGRPCADIMLVETNKGGMMVAKAVRDEWERRVKNGTIPTGAQLRILEIFSREGKEERADPVSAKYERLEVHHVGEHPELERQMTTWDPRRDKSPDRMDALVFAVWELDGRPDPRERFEGLDEANADAPGQRWGGELGGAGPRVDEAFEAARARSARAAQGGAAEEEPMFAGWSGGGDRGI